VDNTVPAKRKFTYTLTIECASEGDADLKQVENLLDLHFQELVMDDTFVNELDEQQAVTIQVIPNFGQK
jgi:archaellin